MHGGAFLSGGPRPAAATRAKFAGEEKDDVLDGGELAVKSQPRPSQMFGLFRKISRVDFGCCFQRT